MVSNKLFLLLTWMTVGWISQVGQPVPAVAQTPTYLDSAAFVPPHGLAVALLRPQAWVGYPDFSEVNQRLLPHEVAAAWGQVHWGMHALAIAEIKMVIGMPTGDQPPPIGFVVTTLEDFDPANLSADVLGGSEPIQDQQRTLYPLAIADAPARLYLDSVDPRTVLIAERSVLSAMREAPSGSGLLADLLRQNPPGNVDLQILIAMQPLHPQLAELPDQLPLETPDELRQLVASAPLLTAIGVRGKRVGETTRLRFEALANDEASAAEWLQRTNQAIRLGRQQALAFIQNYLENEKSGPVTDAWRTYYHRVLDAFTSMAQPRQVGHRVMVDGTWAPVWFNAGFAAGVMLPATQNAR